MVTPTKQPDVSSPRPNRSQLPRSIIRATTSRVELFAPLEDIGRLQPHTTCNIRENDENVQKSNISTLQEFPYMNQVGLAL